MKKWELKKNIAWWLCLIMLISVVNPFFALAEESGLFLASESDEITVTEAVYEPITIDLRATGINGDIFKVDAVEIPAGDETKDGFTIDRHTAMGALVYYCQVNGYHIEISEGTHGLYITQIGSNENDAYNWTYSVDESTPWVGASLYTIGEGQSIHFANNQMSLYAMTLETEASEPVVPGDSVSVTILYTDGSGNKVPVEGAEIYVSETLDAYDSPETADPYVSIGTTDTMGTLTLTIDRQGIFYPYAEWNGRTTQYQWPAPMIQAGLPAQVEIIGATSNRWVKNGNTVLDALLKFQQPEGNFWWTEDTEGLTKFSTVQSLAALVDLGSGGSSKHVAGKVVNLSDAPIELQEAIDLAVSWYRSHHNPANDWEGLTALRAAGEDLNSSPWLTTQTWRTSDPGFGAGTTGNDHIHYIFRLLSVGLNPSNAWGRNLFAELAAQQNQTTGAIGNSLGKHILSMMALDAGRNQEFQFAGWSSDARQKAINYLISQQGTEGHFEDLDNTGWALTALSPYQGQTNVDSAITKVVDFLATRQKDNGGFQPMPAWWGTSPENANTNAAVIAGLAAVGEDLLPEENVINVVDDETPLKITLESGAPATSIKMITVDEGGTKTATLPSLVVAASSDTNSGTFTMAIESGTKVTGPAGWDGTILLPRLLHQSNVTVQNGTVIAAVQVGLTDGTLTFDKPVRLLLPGQAGKSAGFIQGGTFTEITKPLSADTGANLYPGEAGKYNAVDDLVIWTTHFTTFVAYDKTSTPPPSGGGGTPGQDNKASLAVRGHNGGTILPTTEATIDSGETVLSFTQKVLGQNSLSIDVSGGYVRGINGLSELDHGPESGWMFSVNGNYPQIGASSTQVYPGDQIEWRYTLNLGKDLGAGAGPGVGGANQPLSNIGLKEAQEKAVKWILGNRDFSTHDNFTDWDALVLMRFGDKVPEAYWQSLQQQLTETQGTFRLVTDYARIILAATAGGIHGEDVFGHNLLLSMLNSDNMLLQGVNGPAHAILALDAYGYNEPEGAAWNREKLISEIIRLQKRHGGYSLSERADASGDIDLTAMVLQALAPYSQQTEVKKTTEKAISWMLKQPFDNSESISQTMLAFSSLGLDVAEQSFDQIDETLVQELLKYQQDDGGFGHRQGETSNHIATQQAMMALAAYQRYLDQEKAFYNMTDVKMTNMPVSSDPDTGDDVALMLEKIRLADEASVSPWALEWVKKAVAYGLMSGVSSEALQFDPQRELTRAEFAVLMAKVQEETPITGEAIVFKDVQPGSWYFDHVMTARKKGWMSGVGPEDFAPNRSISRQEMAVVLTKALALTAPDTMEEGMTLPKDFQDAADWAKPSVSLTYQHRLMVGDGQRFLPGSAVTREMAAVIMVKLYEERLKH